MPPLFLTWFRAQLIFSEFSLAMKASLPLWRAVKLFLSILLVIVCIFDGGLSMKVEGSFERCSTASWNGEKPCTFASEFFAFMHHNNVKLISMFDSSKTLSSMSAIIKLCLSTQPPLNGASVVVSLNTILILHISIKLELVNSPLLSLLLIFLWLRKFASSFWKFHWLTL